MAVRWRQMRARDIAECVDIIARHPVLRARYGNAIQHLRPAWLRLLECEARCTVVCEHKEGSQTVICAAGVSLFVTDDFVREVKSGPLFWLGPELAKRVARGASPVLSDRQMRESNSVGGLNLLVWEGCIRAEFGGDVEVQRSMINTFIRDHRGYLWKEVIGSQVVSAERLEWMVKTGGSLWNPEKARYVDLSGLNAAEVVKKPHVVGVMPGSEIAEDATWIGGLFDYAAPRFGFSQSEQKLVLAAMDGEGTDIELASALRLSVPTIKNMWASIYRRVADDRPEIISESAHLGANASSRGREKRRRLLSYLREHPEELRPYSLRLVKKKHARPPRVCDGS